MELTQENIDRAMRLYGRWYHIEVIDGADVMAVNYRDARRLARQGHIRPVYGNWHEMGRQTKFQPVYSSVTSMASGELNIAVIYIKEHPGIKL